MKRNGFTLIELIAVIIILAIIALITIPTVLNIVEKAKKGAAEASAYSYIEAIEFHNSMVDFSSGYGVKITSDYDVDTINGIINLTGHKASTIYEGFEIEKNRVTSMTMCINGYIVSYDGKKAKAGKACDSSISGEVNNVLNGNDSILGFISSNTFENDTYGNIVVGDQVYPAHFYNYNGNQVWDEDMSFGDENDVATSSEYAKNAVVVKVNGDLTINEGVTVTVNSTEYGGPKGFILYVTGTLINNGIIDNSHGAKAVGENVYLFKNADGTYEYVPAVGASGGNRVTRTSDGCTNGNVGNSSTTILETPRATGGGGSGAACRYNSRTTKSGAGGAGTSYSGGTGGGGSSSRYTNNLTAGSGSSVGATGGTGKSSTDNGSTYAGGGGAGNPGGTGMKNNSVNSSAKGNDGTGGLLVIYAPTIKNNGLITADGTTGGNPGTQARGGSSGGGSINIFYSKNYESNVDVVASGGKSVSNGGAGGNGSSVIGSISEGTFVKD